MTKQQDKAMYALTKEQLIRDLHKAWRDAKRHKEDRDDVKEFSRMLEKELCDLADDLWNHRYVPLPAICFPIHDPTMREIIAAQFRDCIVNHLYFNYTHGMYERTFIFDSYSCIKGKGTSLGIRRAEHHLRSVTENYTKEAFVLQKDIRGFFVHINRRIAMRIAIRSLKKMASHKVPKHPDITWEDIVDIDFVCYLTETICRHDPARNCIVRGSAKEWEGLPESRSMRKAAPGHGFALGNLNSQLICNVLMNIFDQFTKRVLKCRHYARSTDDFYCMERTKRRIRKINEKIISFLHDVLGLETNEGKTRINAAEKGFRFLGTYIKPYRTYMATKTLKRIRMKMNTLMTRKNTVESIRNSVNSFLGLMSHFATYRLRIKLILPYMEKGKLDGTFNADYTIYTPKMI